MFQIVDGRLAAAFKVIEAVPPALTVTCRFVRTEHN